MVKRVRLIRENYRCFLQLNTTGGLTWHRPERGLPGDSQFIWSFGIPKALSFIWNSSIRWVTRVSLVITGWVSPFWFLSDGAVSRERTRATTSLLLKPHIFRGATVVFSCSSSAVSPLLVGFCYRNGDSNRQWGWRCRGRLLGLPRLCGYRFSAFWLRSSVVSVLISLISDTSPTRGPYIKLIFGAGRWNRGLLLPLHALTWYCSTSGNGAPHLSVSNRNEIEMTCLDPQWRNFAVVAARYKRK